MLLAGTFNSSNGSLTAVVNGSVYTVDKNHPNYELLLDSYKKSDANLFVELYSNKRDQKEILVEKFVEGTGIVLKDSKMYYNGKEVHHSYVSRIFETQKNGFPIGPMLAFFENLLQNPSSRSVDELPDFLMNRNLPLTEDGCFLAYKSVRSDWYSKSKGTLTLLSGKEKDGRIYNAVGELIECLRNEVDDERSHECSKGLHAGGLQYSGPGGSYNSQGDKIVIVKINPKDVVSVPRDHNAQKVRICKYEVIEEFKAPLDNCCVGVDKDVVEQKLLSADSLKRLDEVTFLYQGKNDNCPYRRFVLVEEVNSNNIFGVLLQEDPHFDSGNESRRFMFDNMSDIEMYDPETSYDEDEDYEEDDWDDEEDSF